jgi:hypothetical protein
MDRYEASCGCWESKTRVLKHPSRPPCNIYHSINIYSFYQHIPILSTYTHSIYIYSFYQHILILSTDTLILSTYIHSINIYSFYQFCCSREALLSTCGLSPCCQTSSSTTTYITIHNHSKIRVMK